MSTKTIIFAGIIFLLAIAGVSMLLTAGQKPVPATVAYSVTDNEKPVVETTEISADLGEMKVSDVRQKDFILKNNGSKPLQILNINSSCDCTFGQIIYNGTESKQFGMHAQSGYVTDVAPGTIATVRVVYQPSIMPVYGPVAREVYVKTNDPRKENLVFAIKANVK